MENKEITLELLKELIRNKNVTELRRLFSEYNIVDMSELVEELTTQETLFIFKTLKKNVTSEIFSYLPYDKQETLIEVFTGPEIQAMLDNLYSDDIVDFMEEMPANIVKRILQNVKPARRAEINKLLNYAEDSCGSIMNTNYITLKRNETVAQSIIRLKQLKNIDRALGYAYITDNKRELIGSMSLKRLLYENEEAKIDDIMDTDIVYVHTNDDQEKAAQLIQKYDISTIAVVNDEGKIAGAITYDDIIDVIQEEATEDIHKMSAITPTDKPYLETGVLSMYKHRIVWLLVLMIGATFTGNVLLIFEDRLQGIAYLSVFIPMLMDAAGNAGNQASTMITRALALGELKISDIFKVWFKEFRVAILCGITMGIVNFFRVLVFMGMVDVQTSMVVSVAVMCTVMVAKLIGCTLPMIAVKLGFDPAVMAGPLITTIVDVVALLIYLGLASFFLL
ncbi:magnesium transporter [Breznakia sp. PF5-3]|uniref:magnesium transporter n=1 Tax=unclassified Breznakia TaxID=2623764 RepID=UPI002404A2AC|nr:MULTISPECIES: magnesium transporter [unclassified Breznakia]MDF9825445.1 magnesium transporter [Breznakia sp. PM6-1]MDF9836323.1 magnesium transporter [Breznakia sp. PF5-3]MDF9838554.1 magnesium transporter [Breznakia sp. PFB2-8]MDF9860562.1 magnesium transporter [Breznakia sp. PH5-24]